MCPLDPDSGDLGVRHGPPGPGARGLGPSGCSPAPHPSRASRLRGPHSPLPRGAHGLIFILAPLPILGPFACPSVGLLRVLVGPPQPRQPVGRVPRLGGEAPQASQPGAGLRRVPRPPVSPHPGLRSDGARAGCAPRLAPPPAPAPLAPRPAWVLRPTVIPAGPARALRPRRRRPAEAALGEVVPGGGAGLLRRRALSLVRPLPPHRDAPLLPEAVSSGLFGPPAARVPRAADVSVSAVAMSQGARVSAPPRKLPGPR